MRKAGVEEYWYEAHGKRCSKGKKLMGLLAKDGKARNMESIQTSARLSRHWYSFCRQLTVMLVLLVLLVAELHGGFSTLRFLHCFLTVSFLGPQGHQDEQVQQDQHMWEQSRTVRSLLAGSAKSTVLFML